MTTDESSVATPLAVTNFIIHAISKEQGKSDTRLQEREKAIPVDAKVQRFAEAANHMFTHQAKGLLFAGFDEGAAKEIFQGFLSEFHRKKALDFATFTQKCARHLVDTMKSVSLASGGFLIFAVVKDENDERLCILLLSQELKFAIDEKSLTLRDVPALNLERMGVGCFISLNKWVKEETEPVAYIRGSREVSEYFMRFIGARPVKTPKDSSREIVAFAENFLSEKEVDGTEQTDRRKRLHEYCVKQFRANEPVELSVIGSIVYQENQDAFCRAANAKGISSEFHVDEKHLKGLLEIEYRRKGVVLKLSRSAVRDNVEVDTKRNRLTLKNVDAQTIAEVNEVLG